MSPSRLAVLALAVPLAAGPVGPALAQASLRACETQQELEQVLESRGEFMPDGCREISITAIDTPAGELCVLDFRAEDQGILGTITEAAVPTQWWVACAELRR